jgi:hypothetical protein
MIETAVYLAALSGAGYFAYRLALHVRITLVTP